MKITIAFYMCVLTASPLVAGPPINGTYESQDLGGSMLVGRYSESWIGPNGELQVGNTINVLSWDGTTLGTQWWLNCAEIGSAPLLQSDTVDGSGNGTQVWQVTYSSGIWVLDGNGPWGDGSEPDYVVVLTSYVEQKTFTFSNFQIVDAVASVSSGGQVIGFTGACATLAASSNTRGGTTDDRPKDADYPDFMAPTTCLPTRTSGSWGEASELTLSISECEAPVFDSTWGRIKAVFSD